MFTTQNRASPKIWAGTTHCQLGSAWQPIRQTSDLWICCLFALLKTKPIDTLCVLTCILNTQTISVTFPAIRLPCPSCPAKSVVLTEALQRAIAVAHCLSRTVHQVFLVRSWTQSTLKPRARCLEPPPCPPVDRSRAREMR